MFQGSLTESILRRAQDKELVEIRVHDLRSWTHDRHHVVDDVPYGGGAGMVLKPEPVFEAVEALTRGPESTVVALTPQGIPFGQRLAVELARLPHLIMVCGRYEGFDDRIPQGLRALELSIGDYVLTGGELPALVVLDALVRLIPGVLGDETSAQADSFATGLLEHPHYTRPPVFRGMAVPPVLLTGDHQAIARWRRKQALRRTRERRPDLLAATILSDQDRDLLAEVEADEAADGDGAA
jgi:tRNA (guanine37-N1)-methyltransferase